MSKQKFTCNHCGDEVEWYDSVIHEVGYNIIEDKFYCDDCLKKIAEYFTRNAVIE